MVDAVHEWLNLRHPDDLLRLPTGWKRRVLVVAGLFWQGGPEVEASVVPAAERILSAGPTLDGAGRQQALQCLQWAFCHCLYETVHRQGATLLTQVPYAASHDKSCAVSGLESASSQEFLTRRLLLTPESMAFLPLVVRHPSPLQFVLGAPDALVLDKPVPRDAGRAVPGQSGCASLLAGERRPADPGRITGRAGPRQHKFLLQEEAIMIMASGARLCARSTGNWGSRARLDSLWHGTRVRLYTSTIPAVQTAGRGGCPLAGRMAFAGRPPGTGCTRTVGHLDCRIIRTRAFGSAPEGTGAGTLALSGTVHTFVQGLDVIDRKLLARCLNLQRELVEQLASTGRAPDAALPALQEEALLDSLLAINEVDAFVLACRFLTSMESPTEAILERVAGDAASYSSRMGGRVLKLCALGTPVERPVRVALEQLKAWLGRHREQQRWRALAAVVLDKLSALVMLTRINPEAPESIRRQAVQARGLVPWLLQQEALRLNSAQHAGADYLVRRALDALVELGGWGAEARLGAWYHDWLALGSVYKHQAEPPLPDAGSLAFRDWLPSSYGGQLPRLEEVLAAGPESSGKPEDRPPGRVSAVHQWLARWRPDTRPAAGKKTRC